MQSTTNILELADELAEIARTARDNATGDRLIKIADRLLAEAGLPVVTGARRTAASYLSPPRHTALGRQVGNLARPSL